MSSISFDITGSELIAQLRFNDEIENHKPRFNNKTKSKIKFTNYSNKNMILIDKGRVVSEKSVILIENNDYQGFGYADLKYQINDLDILKNIITNTNNHKDQNNTIISYLKHQTIEKIIRF